MNKELEDKIENEFEKSRSDLYKAVDELELADEVKTNLKTLLLKHIYCVLHAGVHQGMKNTLKNIDILDAVQIGDITPEEGMRRVNLMFNEEKIIKH